VIGKRKGAYSCTYLFDEVFLDAVEGLLTPKEGLPLFVIHKHLHNAGCLALVPAQVENSEPAL